MSESATSAPLQPLQAPRSLAEDAADRIREQILAGGFRQGEHLVEAKIAEQLNISRGPVREAFKLLRAEGLLNEEPRRGTFVVSLSADDVREIYGLRAALEGRAARLIARAHDPATIEQLRTLADAIDAAVATGDGAAVSRADLAFHEGLCALCGNSRILEVFDRYVPTLRALLRLDERVLRSLDEVSNQHRPFVEAIEAGEEETAARLLAEHAEHAGELIAGVVAANEAAPD
ncbi:MAG TPA: GntR family transcriptional regulator [Actinomycetota bacterium]|jgi:GntR family transcriptional regulator, gluconate operon transcriptional repressor